MKKAISFIKLGMFLTLLALASSCATIPKNVKAIENFDKDRYLGKWYEIARFDFAFEKNLDNTTAEYSLNTDGSIKVVNKGYNYKKKKWTSATGKAKFVSKPSEGMLKVSFFGPFYAGYNIVWIDEQYQNALVYGRSTDYMWILSRQKKITEALKAQLVKKAQQDGFDTNKMIWVNQNQAESSK